MRFRLTLLAAAVISLTIGAAVFAASPSKEKIARTAAGNAEAARLVVRQSDLPASWSGGTAKYKPSSSLGCANYKPKRSDLVLIGAAESQWLNPDELSQLLSETDVLRTSRMVKLDWQRTVTAPRATACLRQYFTTMATDKGGELISFGVIAFPKLAAYTRAYRAELKLPNIPSGMRKMEVELVALAGGRDEPSLIVSGPATAKASLRNTALRVSRRLAKRLH